MSQNEEFEKLIGYVPNDVSPYYVSPKNDYKILPFVKNNGEKKRIKGQFKEIPEGFLTLFGRWEQKDDYEPTFSVTTFETKEPEGIGEISLLLEKFFKLSDKQIEKIITKFGENTLKELDGNIDQIDALKLFRQSKKLEEFKKAWQNDFVIRSLRVFLYEYGVTENQILKIIKRYPIRTEERIKENPYILLAIDGIGFKTADKIFLKMGNELNSEKRILISMYYLLKEYCINNRKLFSYIEEFLGFYKKQLGIEIAKEDFIYFASQLSYKKTIENGLDPTIYKSIEMPKMDNYILLYPFDHFNWEFHGAKLIYNILKLGKVEKFEIPDENFDNLDIILNNEQKDAIRNVFSTKFSIIDGQGGTGKSTIIKTVINEAKKRGLSYTLLAPTGKAVDVLANISQESKICSTIHRKIAVRTEGEKPKNSIDSDLIIIDESGMMSLPLLFSTLLGLENEESSFLTNPKKRIVYIGDEGQLKPVGLGAPYIELLNSGFIPVVRLIEIYRQKKDSLILENCQKIRSGDIIDLSKKADDFKFFDVKGFDSKRLIGLLSDVIFDEKFGEKWDNENSIILSYGYEGDSGVNEINKMMQSKLQSSNSYMYKKNFFNFFIGDRVMYNENWYRETDDRKSKQFFPLHLMKDFSTKTELISLFNKYGEDIYPGIDDPFPQKIVLNIKTNEIVNIETKSTIGKIVNNGNSDEIMIFSESQKEENDFDTSVYNGNYGIVVACKTENGWYGINEKTNNIEYLGYDKIKEDNKKEYAMVVKFSNQYVFIPEENLSSLTLFYATTVHKAQGSQFNTVYAFNIPGPSTYFADKYWLYTCLSRVKEKCLYFSTIEQNKKVQLNDSRLNLELTKKGNFINYLSYFLSKEFEKS